MTEIIAYGCINMIEYKMSLWCLRGTMCAWGNTKTETCVNGQVDTVIVRYLEKAFLMRPIINIKTPPPTPPEAMLPIIEPTSSAPLGAAANPSAPRRDPPRPPPRTPATEFPSVPRLNFGNNLPTILPPKAPLRIWMINGIRLLNFSPFHLSCTNSIAQKDHKSKMQNRYRKVLLKQL